MLIHIVLQNWYISQPSYVYYPILSLFADDDEQLRGESRDMTDCDHVATGSTLTG